MIFHLLTLFDIINKLDFFFGLKKAPNSKQIIRFVISFCLLVSLTSCDQFVREKLIFEDLKTERMQEITWDVIDRFPTPPGCNFNTDYVQFSSCLENFVLNLLLEDQKLLRDLKAHFGDRINLLLSVDEFGFSSFASKSHDLDKDQIGSNLFERLNQRIGKVKWNPGFKRGIPVKSSFPYDLFLTD